MRVALDVQSQSGMISFPRSAQARANGAVSSVFFVHYKGRELVNNLSRPVLLVKAPGSVRIRA